MRHEEAGWGHKTKNQAAGAQFWSVKCGWAGFWVEGTLMGWGTSGLRWHGDAIWWCVRGGYCGQKYKDLGGVHWI